MRQLSGTIWPEIIKDNGIIVFNGCHWSSIFCNHSGHHKLIGFSLVIGRLNRFCGAVAFCSFAFSQRIIGKLHPIPVLVPVHSIITACHSSYLADSKLFHLFFQSSHIIFSRCRRSIPSVQETMHVYFC